MTVDLHVVESGDGPAVVLLHAFPLDHRMWDAQRAALSDGFRVITPDLRGFGASPLGEDPPSVDAMADDVAALLDRLGLDRAVIGGLSMGGYVAMAMARRHADRIGALALLDTKASADADAARANRERIAATVEADGGIDVLLTDVLPGLVGATTHARRPDVVAAVTDLVTQAPPPAVAWAQRAMASRPASFDDLAALSVPVLVVVGDEDGLAPPAEAEAMLDVLQDGELALLPECGHLSALERPDDVTALLRDLLLETVR